MTGYVRQSTSEIVNGQPVDAGPLASEFNQLQAAFNASNGHKHTGAAGEAPKITLTAGEGVEGTLPVTLGGTGNNTYENGEILIGNSNENTLVKSTLTGTEDRLTVTNGTGSITLDVVGFSTNTANSIVERDANGDVSFNDVDVVSLTATGVITGERFIATTDGTAANPAIGWSGLGLNRINANGFYGALGGERRIDITRTSANQCEILGKNSINEPLADIAFRVSPVDSTRGSIAFRLFNLAGGTNTSVFINNHATASSREFICQPARDNTTASSSNVFINSSTGLMQRVTSAEKYKRDIEYKIDAPYRSAWRQLQPVWYRSKCLSDNPEWGHYGFIADDADALGLKQLVNYGVDESTCEMILDPYYEPKIPNPDYDGTEKTPEYIDNPKPQQLVPDLATGENTVVEGFAYERTTVFLKADVDDLISIIKLLVPHCDVPEETKIAIEAKIEALGGNNAL